ncbi:YrdB family protein [Demequina aestuarii]|uniref:YrdB family protein n=1 Tax=Demequina aestuarii TaxID=327095 RepID=UPI0007841F2E|nr:YrdB family protein [Demequina aestuarii]
MNGAGSATVFLAELGMYVGVAWWGLAAYEGVWSWIVGIGLPLAVMGIWAVFLSPRAGMPLPDGAQVAVRVALLLVGAAAFWAVGMPVLAIAQAVLAVVGTALSRRGRGDHRP